MKWSLEYSPQCDDDVLQMSPDLAMSICGVVHEFARTGNGVVEQTSEGLRFRVEGAVALCSFFEPAGILYVRRIYRTARR